MSRIILVGACYLDTVLTVPSYPAADSKLRASGLVRRRGGNSPNTLEVLQQLALLDKNSSISASLCAVFPRRDSADMKFAESSFQPPVDMKCIHRNEYENAMSSYIIKSASDDSRTIISYSELPEMSVDEFVKIAEEVGDEANWYHFEGRIPETTLQCVHYLKHNWPNMRISVEVEKPGRQGLEELAALAHVVFYSGAWAKNLGFTNPADFLMARESSLQDAQLLCCTWGSSGACALDRTGLYSVEAFAERGASVLDTIGAGDAFNAGMLWTLLSRGHWSLQDKLAFANELAGRKVLRHGFGGVGKSLLHHLGLSYVESSI